MEGVKESYSFTAKPDAPADVGIAGCCLSWAPDVRKWM